MKSVWLVHEYTSIMWRVLALFFLINLSDQGSLLTFPGLTLSETELLQDVSHDLQKCMSSMCANNSHLPIDKSVAVFYIKPLNFSRYPCGWKGKRNNSNYSSICQFKSAFIAVFKGHIVWMRKSRAADPDYNIHEQNWLLLQKPSLLNHTCSKCLVTKLIAFIDYQIRTMLFLGSSWNR